MTHHQPYTVAAGRDAWVAATLPGPPPLPTTGSWPPLGQPSAHYNCHTSQAKGVAWISSAANTRWHQLVLHQLGLPNQQQPRDNSCVSTHPVTVLSGQPDMVPEPHACLGRTWPQLMGTHMCDMLHVVVTPIHMIAGRACMGALNGQSMHAATAPTCSPTNAQHTSLAQPPTAQAHTAV